MKTSSRQTRVGIGMIAFALLALAGYFSAPGAQTKQEPRDAANGSRTVLAQAAPATPAPAVQPNPDRNAYFGETHVHTSWSLDAFSLGNVMTTPADSYKYFKGQPIKHPLGYDVKIDTPLDWAGVTDHSEYAGVVQLANDPSSPVSKLPAAQPLILKARTKEDMEKLALYIINNLGGGPPVKALMSPEIAGGVWKKIDRDGRRSQRAREIHGVLLVRMDLDAEQHEPAPQRLLQGVQEGAGAAVQCLGFVPPGGSLELDGWPAQGGQRAPRHLAQRQSLRRPDVPDRSRHQGPPDRRRLRRFARSQREADRDPSAQGHLRDASLCFRPTTSSPASSSCRSCWAIRRDAFHTSSAAMPGRR